MKKLVFILVVPAFLAATSWAVATYVLGSQAKQQYQALIEQVSETQGVKLVKSDYERGYVSSTAHTTFEIQIPDDKKTGTERKPLQLTLEHTIKHGPLPFDRDSDGKLNWKPVLAVIKTRIPSNPDMQGSLKNAVKEIPELGMIEEKAVVYLEGDGKARIDIPPFQRSLPQEKDTVIHWKGLTGEMTFSAGFGELKGTLKAPGLKIEDDAAGFEVTGVEASFDIRKDAAGLNVGDAAFGIAAIQFEDRRKEPTPESFSLSGCRVKSSSSASGDHLNSTFTLELDRIAAGGSHYGPGNLDMEFRRIDIPSLLKFQQAMEEMDTVHSPQSKENMKKAVMAKLAVLLPGFVKTSPEVEIRQINIKTDIGNFQGRAKLGINAPANAGGLNNFLVILTALSFDAEAVATEELLTSMARSVIKENLLKAGGTGESQRGMDSTNAEVLAASIVSERLDSLVESSILIREKDCLKVSASYKTGEVILNGRSVSLLNFLQ